MTIARSLQVSALFVVLTAPALAAAAPPRTDQSAVHGDKSATEDRTKPKQAQPEVPTVGAGRSALPTLPLFELPEQASDNARLHVRLAHARRDSHRAQHTRAGQAGSAQHGKSAAQRSADQKPVQKQLSSARARVAAAQPRRDVVHTQQLVAQERRAAAGERRFQAQERRSAAAQHRDAATAQRLNAAELQAAAQERRTSAGRK